jgi:hypothetical protein
MIAMLRTLLTMIALLVSTFFFATILIVAALIGVPNRPGSI